jgi:hypothetical protein
MLWNAASNDEINVGNVGSSHPSDPEALIHPRAGGIGHIETEDEFLASRRNVSLGVS